MKNTPKFAMEVVITIIIAALVSLVIATLIGFVSENMGWGDEGMMYTTAISSSIFGIIVGYKLNSLIRKHK